ncbi:MAG TPA: BamA/TamA family outer membrane protein [Thermoanaerobaculia bacterium]|nr:BamA/TamA family outer membrane protein [Thermoanaerobaculia bacterium]
MKRSIALLFLLTFVAVPAFPFGQNKIVYDKFTWNIYHSTHFDIYFYDEERDALQRVVDSAESAYMELSQKFNYQISKKIPLIFYHTHSAFEQTNVMLNFIPEGVGAFAEPARNRMVLPIDMSDDKLHQLILHELTHIFEYEVFFQGKLGKTVAANPPTWLMEGLASFMAQDEDSRDRMVLRDAVVNDRIPTITRNPQGYFAYRFGHAVFRYMQEKYGWDGLRDFIYEYRNTLGNTVDRALKRAFDVEPDEFDTAFRTWLRKQYLPALVAKGEPQEYGEPFKIGDDKFSNDIAPVPSPSGDLLAAFATYKEDVDVVLFNIPERKLLKNLTSGYTSRYQYPIAQAFTTAPVMGRDIAWSPNGDAVAVFVRRERGRDLLMINPITGDIIRSVPMDIEQQLSPAFSPDGRKVAFSGWVGTQPDLFIYDVESGAVENITNDRYFDGAPVFSPDGKSLIFSSVVDTHAKLFRLDLDNPTERFQITSGPWNDIDAWFSPDGKRIFFASDKQTGRNAVAAAELLEEEENRAKPEGETPAPDPTNFASYNIYSLNLENGDLLQYTDVIGGCFTPVVFTSTNNKERLVFASYYKGQWRLFSAPTDSPLHEAEKTEIPSAPVQADARSTFRPASEFFIDEEKIEASRGFKLFIDDIEVNAGVTSDQIPVSRSTIYMSDMLGNRRFIASLDSVSSFSNFDFIYLDLQRRMNWGVRLFDNRSFFTQPDFELGQIDRVKQTYRETGAMGLVSYPFTRYHRIDAGAGYISRQIAFPFIVGQQLAFFERRDDYPVVSSAFSGDTTSYKFFGPISGRRYNLSYSYAPDLDEGGTLSQDINVDFRQYYQLSSRTLLAARLFVGYSTGNFSNFYYFGGLNTLRGYDFRTIVGNQAAFANFEFRFPLVDVLATPFLVLQQIRGVVFFDIGGARFDGLDLSTNEPFKFVEGGELRHGRAAVGYGFSFNFWGLELHWDFARRLKRVNSRGQTIDDDEGYKTSFWIGQTF